MNKRDIIKVLREHWTDLGPIRIQGYICSLLGHRMKFETIAKLIGRTRQEVSAAWKGFRD